jgi:hypothetical protein
MAKLLSPHKHQRKIEVGVRGVHQQICEFVLVNRRLNIAR